MTVSFFHFVQVAAVAGFVGTALQVRLCKYLRKNSPSPDSASSCNVPLFSRARVFRSWNLDDWGGRDWVHGQRRVARQTVHSPQASPLSGSRPGIAFENVSSSPAHVQASGEVIERHGVVTDVTDRRKAEEDLCRSRAELRALAARLQSAQEEERLRISRAIHDDLGEMLTSLRFEISAIGRSLRRDQRDLRSRARAAMRLIDSSIIRVRKVATGLRPGLLDALGLEAALEAQVKEFQMRTGIACLTELPPEKLALRNDQATALYRIVQESLTNIARHAQAHHVQISLMHRAGLLVLEVKDDGKGFALQARQWTGSLGIAGMRERALALGGSMEIVSRPGNGTTVRARLPLNLSLSAGDSR